MKTRNFGARVSKVLAVAACLLALASVPAFAQVGPAGKDAVRSWLKDLRITDQEMAALKDAVAKDEEMIAKARADIRIQQSSIARLMLETQPDKAAIGAAVDASLQAEKTLRLAQIDRQIALRTILGEERWRKILRLIREARIVERGGKGWESFSRRGLSAEDARRWSQLLGLLRQCF